MEALKEHFITKGQMTQLIDEVAKYLVIEGPKRVETSVANHIGEVVL